MRKEVGKMREQISHFILKEIATNNFHVTYFLHLTMIDEKKRKYAYRNFIVLVLYMFSQPKSYELYAKSF